MGSEQIERASAMRFILFLLPLVTFFFSSILMSQIAEPIVPTAPIIVDPLTQFDSSMQKSSGPPTRCDVLVVGEGTNRGTISFPSSAMTFYFEKNGKPFNQTYFLTNLESIHFLKWKGYKQKDSSYIFYPISTRVSLKDGSSFTCSYYLESLGKLEHKSFLGSTILYTYFYEYRSGGQWQNSKKKELTYPETHPPKGCLLKIIFQ
jgi:hypothetical protein